jgi:hypothetical protein
MRIVNKLMDGHELHGGHPEIPQMGQGGGTFGGGRRLDVRPDDGSWRVRVGGGVRIVGEGVFRVVIGD